MPLKRLLLVSQFTLKIAYRTFKPYVAEILHVLNVALHQHSPKGAYSWSVNSLRNVAPVER